MRVIHPIVPSFPLFHYLLHFLHQLFSHYSCPKPAPVFDISGNKIRAGAEYYILPVIRGRGGGLTLATTGNKTCPLGVAQEQFEVKNGLPLTFKPVNSTKGVIRVSTDYNIKFSTVSNCVQSTVWKLDFDDSIGKYFIMTGGVEGKPGRKTISNWFKIEKYERDYKLVFCPTVCDYCKVICRDIGVFVEDGKRRISMSYSCGLFTFNVIIWRI